MRLMRSEAFKRMGFDLPESVKDLLDKKLELRVNLPQLESIVDKYRTLMTNLDPDMYLILKRQVFKLETCILPGTSNYNWSYTKLDHFLAKCNKTLDLFRALFDQVKKIENLLDLKIQQIAQVNLFDLGEKRPSTDKSCSAAPSVDPPDCSGANKTPFLDFVRKMEHRRNLEMEKILYIVDRMSPALRKIEEMVFGTNTGRRKEMLCYYERYELRLHECFLALISSNLECFTGLLEGNTALFQIQALLMKHSPLLQPPVQTVGVLLKRDFEHLLDRFKIISLKFHKGLEDVETASVIYLNEIFERLRASEKCLQLLQRLHRVQARPRIGEALGDKYELIMSKFLKEVIWVDQEFTKNWKNPPLVKGQTRKAGSVYWVRHLASKLKRTVLLFQQVPELMCLESKEEAFAEYRTVVKQLETFEQVTYHDWL
ncbi:dynein heavy chain 8, axonemal-like [Diaphorina citri]|uniref:Dynein heavy chain 8, axonemal-like n=1 Tax=Diaphorina citri TaxID=121845 RepID=A0A3Q0JF83_DIACI|nr:dynein heavy chain 8, axonemal-like [Diaphorina citri]